MQFPPLYAEMKTALQRAALLALLVAGFSSSAAAERPQITSGAVKVSHTFSVKKGAATYLCGGPLSGMYLVGTLLKNGKFLSYNRRLSNLIALAKDPENASVKSAYLATIKKLQITNAKARGVCDEGPPKVYQLWSDPKTWNGRIPKKDASVFIPEGKNVLLDVSPPHLKSVYVEGSLKVARKNINLTTGYLIATGQGEFLAGTQAKPFIHKLTITLTGEDPNDDGSTMGDRLMGAMGGGKIDLIGETPTVNWTMLNKTVEIGDDQILVQEETGWRVGDEIVITSTDYDFKQAEQRKIISIQGKTLHLDKPLAYFHFGEIQNFAHDILGTPHELDERAEVGLLSHRIKIQGAQDIPGVRNSDGGTDVQGYGGHVMIMGNDSRGRFQGVEFFRMGQFGIKGRYPIHWHNVNESGAYSFIRSSSVHRSFNRCMTVHKTNFVQLSDNVSFDTYGHCYFIEDGREIGNVFHHNLGVGIKAGPLDEDPEVKGGNTPSVFWISNPNNTFTNNAAAGSDLFGMGFMYALHRNPRSLSISANPAKCDAQENYSDPECYHPDKQPFGIFRGNRAHSTSQGIWPNHDRDAAAGVWGANLGKVEDFTAFRLGGAGIWFRTVYANPSDEVIRARIKGPAQAVFASSDRAIIKHSLFVGQSANPTVREEGDNFIALGQYDGSNSVESSVFINHRGVFGGTGTVWQGHQTGLGIYEPSQFINSYIGWQISWPTAEHRHRHFYVIPDAGNISGFGPGTFVSSPLMADSVSKGYLDGAKGIEPGDTGTFWTPYSTDAFAAFHIGRADRWTDGSLQREDQDTQYIMWGGGNPPARAVLLLNHTYTVKFDDPSPTSDVGLSLDYVAPGYFAKIKIPAPSLPFNIYKFDWIYPVVVPSVSSLSELDNKWDESSWFLDNSGPEPYVYLKVLPGLTSFALSIQR